MAGGLPAPSLSSRPLHEGRVDVLVEASLRKARIADRRRTVGRGIDVVGDRGARLEDVESVVVVRGPGFARVSSRDEVPRVGEDDVSSRSPRGDIDVVAPEWIAPGGVRLPVVVAGHAAHGEL